MRSITRETVTACLLALGLTTIVAMPLLVSPSEQSKLSPRAERVFYRDMSTIAWGTLCALEQGGFVSVQHVTANGVPKLGPTASVTAENESSDWAFLGIEPKTLNPDDFPALAPGQKVEIHGFPARDRDGEIIPGKVYTHHTLPPFIWIELQDAASGIDAEGVIGGFSGSCVFDAQTGDLLAVVHANGFSQIDGTTHTWALVVPIREAIREAQGLAVTSPPLALLGKPLPNLAVGQWAINQTEAAR